MPFGSDHIITEAIQLREKLLNVATEIGYREARSPAAIELRDMDKKTVEDAARMLRKLGMEVTRLRMAIGHHHYGRMTRGELCQICDTWNGDPAAFTTEFSQTRGGQNG